jgi:hypothetical protein
MNKEKAKEFLEEKEEFRYVNNLAERVKIPWYTIIKWLTDEDDKSGSV